jgi:endonuclease III related protein
MTPASGIRNELRRREPRMKPSPSSTGRQLRRIYDALYRRFGPQGWWPGRTRTEIVVGAILTQNTSWKNVEQAIARLRAVNMLDWAALRDVPVEKLAELIRPAGYFNIKAARLKHFVTWLWDEHGGDFDSLVNVASACGGPSARGVAQPHAAVSRSVDDLRAELLAIKGIGPETADSILLYALDYPTFVVDAYTARVTVRHQLIDAPVEYAGLKALFEDHLEADARLFNEYHALLVAVGKEFCKPRAQCSGCPLERFDHDAGLA